MPRVCTICQHPQRSEIDRALVAGTPLRDVAERYATTATTLHRHKEHIGHALADAARSGAAAEAVHATALVRQQAAREAADARQVLDVVQQLKAINASSIAILKEARDDKKHGLALQAIDRVHRQIELQAKLLGELQQEGTTNITINTQWVQVLLHALAPYPDARAAAAAALLEFDDATP
jgi:hypothetical protein